MLWAQSGNCRRLLWPDPLWGLAGTGPLLVLLSQDLFGWGLPGEQSVAAWVLPLLMFLEALSQRARWLGWDGSVPYQPGWHGCALGPAGCVCGCCS